MSSSVTAEFHIESVAEVAEFEYQRDCALGVSLWLLSVDEFIVLVELPDITIDSLIYRLERDAVMMDGCLRQEDVRFDLYQIAEILQTSQ